MKTKLLLLLLLIGSTSLTFAQSTQRFATKLTGTCSTASADCSTVDSALVVSSGGYTMATVTINGTYSGSTVFFEWSDDGRVTWYPDLCTRTDTPIQASTEALAANQSRAYQCNPPAGSNFRVRQSALSTGVPNVAITLSPSSTPVAQTVITAMQPTAITVSATGTASAANSVLPGVAGKTTYITGFQVTGGGATAASVISVTVTGTITGTMNYNIPVPAGVTLGITPLIVSFPIPIPASAVNTAITVNVPTFGAGNTNSASAAQGFQQ